MRWSWLKGKANAPWKRRTHVGIGKAGEAYITKEVIACGILKIMGAD